MKNFNQACALIFSFFLHIHSLLLSPTWPVTPTQTLKPSPSVSFSSSSASSFVSLVTTSLSLAAASTAQIKLEEVTQRAVRLHRCIAARSAEGGRAHGTRAGEGGRGGRWMKRKPTLGTTDTKENTANKHG